MRTRLEITIDKAPDLATAEAKAREIADKFYGHVGTTRSYQLEQAAAQPEQQTVALVNGDEIPVGDTTFWVTFIARRLT